MTSELAANRKYLKLLSAFMSAPLLLLGAYNYANDPYWLFFEKPPWRQLYNGHNRVLDIHMRHAKALQTLVFQPRRVILGSSKVFRGMPTDRYQDLGLYNLGISSLRIREARAFVQHLARFTATEEILFGIDPFMFYAENRWESGFDAKLGSLDYIAKVIPTSLFSLSAYEDSKLALAGEQPGDGLWTRSGYKRTRARNAVQMQVVLGWFYTEPKSIGEPELREFDSLLRIARAHGIRVNVFISPMNRLLIDRMREFGVRERFDDWRARVKAMADHAGVRFNDFSIDNPYRDEPVLTRSTRHWIDPSHYGPAYGEWILRQTGFVPAARDQP